MEKNQLTPKPAKLARLDLALVERGLCESREKAKRAVMAGQALVNGQRAAKASDKVKPSDEVTLAATDKFVSRGGYKLEHALETFGVEAAGYGRSILAPQPAVSPIVYCNMGGHGGSGGRRPGAARVGATQRRTRACDGANERTTPHTGKFPAAIQTVRPGGG
ncbi:MAG: hypothetical protein Ct9H300mP32_1440 [Verrucomicrobiota bacterium]|nr:MAG: hypothetical protein Ct9H300mP32_1440 [Verrucomicrobiota bacterium]